MGEGIVEQISLGIMIAMNFDLRYRFFLLKEQSHKTGTYVASHRGPSAAASPPCCKICGLIKI